MNTRHTLTLSEPFFVLFQLWLHNYINAKNYSLSSCGQEDIKKTYTIANATWRFKLLIIKLTISVLNMFEKENSLSFYNIARSLHTQKEKTASTCCCHPDRTAKYRHPQRQILYCTSCAIQQASRGTPMQPVLNYIEPSSSHSISLSLLQEVFQQSQAQIQQSIDQYNSRYQKLIEVVMDMKIRDLIGFNRKIEENNHLYKQLKEQQEQEWSKSVLVQLFNNTNTLAIIAKIETLTQQISSNQSRNQQVSSMFPSNHESPRLPFRSRSPMQSKNRSQTIKTEELKLNVSNISLQEKRLASRENSSQSFGKSPQNTNSLTSKNSTVEEMKKSVLQDTPESVKMKMSQNGLRVTKDMAATMFEKIDVCQSISLSQSQVGSVAREESVCSGRSRNRYHQQSREE